MEIKGTVAIVTGGTGGLGSCICRSLAGAGAHVVVVYAQSRDKAESLAEELGAEGPRALALQSDLTTPEGIARLVSGTMESFGRIDILVNDAAYNKFIPFQDLRALDAEVWGKLLDCNLTAPYMAMRAVADPMRLHGKGRIVNIASTAGFQPRGSSIGYAVSKAGLVHLTRCMAVALAPDILVNCVAPGFMEGTRMTENLSPEFREVSRDSSALKRPADKDDVADAVMTMIRTDSITGQTLVVDCGRVFH